MRALRSCLVLLGVFVQLGFGQQTISDDTFKPADWTASQLSAVNIAGQSFSGSQTAAGGNPGAFRTELHNGFAFLNFPGILRGLHTYGPQTLSLTNGISTINYSYDLALFGPGISASVEYRIALRQGINVYVGSTIDTVAFGTPFTTFSGAGLTSNNFCFVVAATGVVDCTTHPDFSVGAAAITVGYQIANTVPVGQSLNFTSFIDNFSVSANPLAATSVLCTTSGVQRAVRIPGSTELVGDVLLTCTGGNPTPSGVSIPQVNLSLIYTLPVTTPIIGLTTGGTPVQRSGALLLVDEPAPNSQFVCDNTITGFCGGFGNGGGTGYYGSGVQSPGSPNNRNVYAGVVTNGDTITFIGIPFDGPGAGTRTFRVVNVRVDTAGAGVNAAVSAALVIQNPPANLQLNNNTAQVATVSSAVISNVRDAANAVSLVNGAPFQLGAVNAFQKAVNLRFGEGFATAFMARSRTLPPSLPDPPVAVPTPLAQNTPGQAYTSETGFYNPAFPSVANIGTYNLAGLATQGTRLVAKFKNIPAGTQVFVDLNNIGANSIGNAARLTATENGAFSAVPATAGLPVSNVAQLTVTSGTATAVWEILIADPLASTNFDFGFYYSSSAVPGGSYPTPQVDFTIVPADPESVTGLVPRFGIFTDPRTLFNFLNPVNPFTCTASATPRLLRETGVTELVSDIVLTCTGGTPAAVNSQSPQTNFQLTSNAFITTPVNTGFIAPAASPYAAAGAFVFLDEPATGSQFLCLQRFACASFGNGTGQGYYGSGTQSASTPNVRNVYSAYYPLGGTSQTVTSPSRTIVWDGVPVDGTSSGVRIFRFTGVRVSTLNLGTANVIGTISSTLPITINNATLNLGTVSHFMTTALRDGSGGDVLPPTGIDFPQNVSMNFKRAATLQFRKEFATAFRPRIASTLTSLDGPPPIGLASQTSLGAIYNSESGFFNPAFPNVVPGVGNASQSGLMDQGTRLVARFNNLPAGAQVYVDLYNTGAVLGSRVARLTNSEFGPFAATAATAGLPVSNVAQLTITNGSAVAVWEVLGADLATATSNWDFGFYLASTPLSATVSPTIQMSAGPVDGNELPVSFSAPRFIAPSLARTLISYSTLPTQPPAVVLPALLVNPGQLTFFSLPGLPGFFSPVPPQSLSITSSGENFPFSVSTGGILPLSLSAVRGNTAGSVSVSVNTTGLAPGTYKDTVTVTAGGTSNGSVSVPISVVVRSNPVISALDPPDAGAGGTSFNLTVNGRGFLPGASVNFGGSTLTPTSSSAGQLVVPIAANLIAQAGTISVSVTNPDGVVSNSVDFAVRRLNITLLTPAVRTATSAGFALTVNGTGFLPGATVEFGGTLLSPSGSTTSSLTVNVPASALVQVGTVQVSVTNPNRQASNSLPFVIRPVPVIESSSPKPIPVGSAAVTLTVTGRNFFDGVKIRWNGQDLATTFGSATQLGVTVPANLITQLGSAVLTALTPDVVVSAGYIQPIGSVTTNVPALTVGDGPVTIVITGTGFGPNPVVQFSCPPAPLATLVTSSGSNTSVTAVIPAALITQPGTCQIIVTGPNGPIFVDVPVNPRPQISALSQNNSVAGGTAPLTLTVSGTGFEPGSVVRWNGAPLATTPAPGGLQAIVPVTLLAVPGSVTVTVVGPRGSTSNGVPFTVSLPPVSLQLTVPSATTPSKDETVTLGLGAAFPVDLVGTLTLTFRGDGTLPDDPAIQFSNNSRTLPINIPAGTRPVINAIFKTGTIAGVITLTPQFTSGGAVVAGTGLGPQTLTVPRQAPVLTAVTCTRASGAFNVVTDGYTNTRQATQAQFTFTGDNLGTTSLGVDATTAFNTWAAGNSPGGTFRYTQAFNVQGNVNAITTVAVRLTNSVGQSAERSASCQ